MDEEEVLEGTEPRKGWLINMLPSTRKLEVDSQFAERACLNLYFLCENGLGRFSSFVVYEPYFYVLCRPGSIKLCKPALEKKFEKELLRVELIELEDLDQLNHLSFKRQGNGVLKLLFRTVNELMQVRKVLLPLVKKNQSTSKSLEAYANPSVGAGTSRAESGAGGFFRSRKPQQQDEDIERLPKAAAQMVAASSDPMQNLVDLREYDVPYYQRVCIDLDLNAGCWFSVRLDVNRGCVCRKMIECIDQKAEPVVLAFDLECTKQPLKFPNPAFDEIYMISYMVDRNGFLLVNRAHVSNDVADFEYTPKADFPGPFEVINLTNEKEMLKHFFQHCRDIKPTVYVTYNGDSFDFPFLDARAIKCGLNMKEEIGIYRVESSSQSFESANARNKRSAKPEAPNDNNGDDNGDNAGGEDEDDIGGISVLGGGEYRGNWSVHMDCLYWVKRDSYLPAGSRSLKAVTKAKLGYDPVEVDPEEMMNLARDKPNHMAAYSVSDAVSTFYLFDKYVNLFIFSLCTIIPLGAEDVLRKGSGTLCESLLMVEAFQKRIICPNKQLDDQEKFYKGHLLETETYVGGHVECLESGVFREDVPIPFNLDPKGFATLRGKIDRDLRFAIEVEGGNRVDECVNFDQIKYEIESKLAEMEADCKRVESPLIYHLDVGAMYPNIILTNRLQPCAIVDDVTCASCDFNRADSNCKREMKWDWRGEMYPASKSEYNQLASQLEYETFDGQSFRDLSKSDKQLKTKSWLKSYCQKTYRRVKDTVVESRKATICMRENPFYVDTVKAFRDRRNEYKKQNKVWGKKTKEFPANSLERIECEAKVLLYDSLQLAHKCILNSFYGYVMRKGARWHSMEMAAVVTKTGSDLIKQARVLVEQVGKPLELDTDGIWCVFPKSFPDHFQFEFKDKSKLSISYPCVMLNSDVHDAFTNHQYQTLVGTEYVTNSECSIFFELDGPYRCMVLPASQEEGKLLKKRYAVFNRNGTIAELKGFELKRRGELKIIKIFQSQVFERFLHGKDLHECYQAVGEIANFWLDVLYTKARDLSDDEVIDLISENRSMSKSLQEYGDQKSTSITTAKRLAEFLGQDMVRDKGLACQLLVSSKPYGSPTTERAVPTLIFSASKEVRHSCLKRWLKDSSLPTDLDVREVIDWEYYIDRLGKAVQKIITIPAALQLVSNPCPRVKHPEWLARRVREKYQGFTQLKIDALFTKKDKSAVLAQAEAAVEEEEEEVETKPAPVPIKVAVEPFEDWLATRKTMWQDRRNSSKRSKRALGEKPAAAPAPPLAAAISLTRFAQQSQALQLDPMQLIEIRETLSEPGVLSLLVGGMGNPFRTVRVTMPRVVYMDSSNDFEEQQVALPHAVLSRTKITNCFLPQSRPFHHLFKLEIDEAQFRVNGKELNNFFTRPEVLGVYEMNVSLMNRALAELELFVQVREKPARRGDPVPYSALSALRNESAHTYLAVDDGGVSRAFLYHAGTGKRQIFALFMVAEDHREKREEDEDDEMVIPKQCSKSFVWFMGKSATQVNVNKVLGEALHELGFNTTTSEFAEPTKVELNLDTAEECWKEVRAAVQDLVRHHGSRLVLLVQSITTKQRVVDLLGGLDSTPCVELAGDFAAADTCFPAMLWTKPALKQAMKKYLQHANWFHVRVQSARFGRLPMAHLGEDHLIQVSDFTLARSLQHNRMVSWASPSSPDLGGVQDEDVSHLIVQGEFENPYVMNPAAYRQVCVEIDVANLAMGALLNADKITEIDACLGGGRGIDLAWMEYGALGEGDKWSLSHGDSTRAFKVIKAMAYNWFCETLDEQRPAQDRRTAYALLGQSYRWVASTKSQLRDPSIHRMMHSLMSKLFFRLLAEIKRLGGGIVTASFERLVVSCADRTDPLAARDWLEHLVRTLHEMDLFQHLHFEVGHFWRQYLFLDTFNWGGIRWEAAGEESPLAVTHHWNVVSYLPKPIQAFALVIIAEFVYKPAKRALLAEGEEAEERDNDGDDDEEEDYQTQDAAERRVIRYIRRLVSETFTRRLLEFVPLVVSQHHDFPLLPGSYLTLTNAALELVKTLCFVLHLDHRSRDQVRVMKRQVLKTIHVLEFSPEAAFRAPSLELVLPDVICSNCNYCEDIDLCRDERMLVREGDQDQGSGDEDDSRGDGGAELGQWNCNKCRAAYDKTLIESNLVDICHRRALAFQLQDLVCVKCRTIRSDNLSEFCACSGQWQWAQITSEEFATSLRPFARVAEYHGMEWLDGVVQFALQYHHSSHHGDGEDNGTQLFHFEKSHLAEGEGNDGEESEE
ncbi:hypothetical protein BASA81_006573 [Batrachochytrium salamandrivorans]|nr:hypothetical protein BASA81_006573 [Batrachochytrium salamandrivorans]